QVPLLVKLPKSREKGTSVGNSVQLTDVFPTIVEQTASSAPPRPGNARSLLASILKTAPGRAIYSETFYPRFHFGWSDLHSLIDADHHFIRAPIAELYDLKSDPGEKKNTIDDNRRTYVAMRNAIEPILKQATAPT